MSTWAARQAKDHCQLTGALGLLGAAASTTSNGQDHSNLYPKSPPQSNVRWYHWLTLPYDQDSVPPPINVFWPR